MNELRTNSMYLLITSDDSQLVITKRVTANKIYIPVPTKAPWWVFPSINSYLPSAHHFLSTSSRHLIHRFPHSTVPRPGPINKPLKAEWCIHRIKLWDKRHCRIVGGGGFTARLTTSVNTQRSRVTEEGRREEGGSVEEERRLKKEGCGGGREE